MKAWRMRLPSSVRIGMFCRLGSVEDSRPVRGDRHREAGVHAPGLRVDLLRPARRRRWIFSFCSCRQSRMRARQFVALVGQRSAAPRQSVPQAPVFIRLPPGSFISSNSTSPSCLGLPTLNVAAGQAVDLCSITAMRCSKSTDMRRRSSASTLTPGALHVQQHRDQPALDLLVQRQRRRSRAGAAAGVCHSRSATSASSAAYAVARSIGTCAKLMRLRPVPVTSS